MTAFTTYNESDGIADIVYADTPGTGLTTTYVNQVWDPGGSYVQWESTGLADTSGASYPDPYGSGFVACSGFHVLAIRTG